MLAVVAHPDDESFGLGAVLSAFTDAGADVKVFCFTHGEASTLHGVAGDLNQVRAEELADAGAILGVTTTMAKGYADGTLASTCPTRMAGDVLDAARSFAPDGLCVFDPSGVTGHPDHAAASAAALSAADVLDLPVVGWTLPAAVAKALNDERGTAFTGHRDDEVDFVVHVARDRQYAAAAAHVSQALPTSVLWRRLDLLGDVEALRCLRAASRMRTPARSA